eukprot:2775721-Rhodomonas_salina.1
MSRPAPTHPPPDLSPSVFQMVLRLHHAVGVPADGVERGCEAADSCLRRRAQPDTASVQH